MVYVCREEGAAEGLLEWNVELDGAEVYGSSFVIDFIYRVFFLQTAVDYSYCIFLLIHILQKSLMSIIHLFPIF